MQYRHGEMPHRSSTWYMDFMGVRSRVDAPIPMRSLQATSNASSTRSRTCAAACRLLPSKHMTLASHTGSCCTGGKASIASPLCLNKIQSAASRHQIRFTGGEGGAGGAQAMLRETDVSVTCCIGGALSRRATVGLFAPTEGQAFLLWSIYAPTWQAKIKHATVSTRGLVPY